MKLLLELPNYISWANKSKKCIKEKFKLSFCGLKLR